MAIAFNPIENKNGRYHCILNVVQESKSWLDIEAVSSLCGLSSALCRPVLIQLVQDGMVGHRIKPNANSPAGTVIYAKPSIARDYEVKHGATTEYKEAKSRFQLTPHALNGGSPKEYVTKVNQQPCLAMLVRKA